MYVVIWQSGHIIGSVITSVWASSHDSTYLFLCIFLFRQHSCFSSKLNGLSSCADVPLRNYYSLTDRPKLFISLTQFHQFSCPSPPFCSLTLHRHSLFDPITIILMFSVVEWCIVVLCRSDRAGVIHGLCRSSHAIVVCGKGLHLIVHRISDDGPLTLTLVCSSVSPILW